MATISGAYAECLIERQDYAKAFQVLESARAKSLRDSQSLREMIEKNTTGKQRSDLLSTYDEIQAIEAVLRMSDDERFLSEAVLSKQLRANREELQKGLEGLPQRRTSELAELLGAVPANGAIVILFRTGTKLGAFVVPSGAMSIKRENVIFPLPMTEQQFLSLANGRDGEAGWIGAMLSPKNTPSTLAAWRKTVDQTLKELGSAIKPILERLKDLRIAPGTPVVLIPDSSLALLPWQAAYAGASEDSSLGGQYTVSYAPGLSALRASSESLKRVPERTSLAAFVNPTSDLDYGEAEGNAVARLFPEASRMVFSGEGVTRKAILESTAGAKYIHYSGHADFLTWNPTVSGLQLEHNQRLSVSEILGLLRLENTRLVVLSACETAATDFSENDFVGLPTAFLQAGAAAVVGTLWPVNDSSTALLMSRFYESHLGRKTDPAKALKEAQLWLRGADRQELERYWRQVAGTNAVPIRFPAGTAAHPFSAAHYWAGFVIYGR